MVSKKIVVDLFYDIISPYGWIGFEKLARHANIWSSVSLQLKPCLLGFIMKGSGNQPPLVVAAKASYMPGDLDTYSKMMGMNLRIPGNFPHIAMKVGSRVPMSFVAGVDILTDGKSTEAVSREFWKRLFGTHEDIHEMDSLRAVGQVAGLSGDLIEKVIGKLGSDEVKGHLKKNTDEALKAGAFGVPTMVAHLPDGPKMFFGSDRVEVLAHVLGEPYQGPLIKFSKL